MSTSEETPTLSKRALCTQEEPTTLFFISTDLFSDSNILENKNHRITTLKAVVPKKHRFHVFHITHIPITDISIENGFRIEK